MPAAASVERSREGQRSAFSAKQASGSAMLKPSPALCTFAHLPVFSGRSTRFVACSFLTAMPAAAYASVAAHAAFSKAGFLEQNINAAAPEANAAEANSAP